MEMQQIRYFLAVCDQGSITHAAQLTYVSQPSLTQAIKKLEDEMGGILFTRAHSGCQLTPLGRMVEANLRKIYRDLQATKAEAIRFTRLNTIPLRIGLMTTIGCELREDLKCICQNQEINLYAAYRSNSEEWILRMVQAGIGVALMSEYTLPKDATDVRFRYLVDPEISRQVYVIYTHQTSAKPELPALIDDLSKA